MPLAGKSGSTRLEGQLHRHHRIIYILRILSTDRHSQRMIMSMISRKMDKADRGVSQPNETRGCRKGKVGGKILLLITTPTIGKSGWHGRKTLFFFDDNSIRYGFAFSQRTLHKLQSKAEVATESCEGKVAACFCQGYGISDGHIPHLTFVNT